MLRETLRYTTTEDLKAFARTFIKHKDSHIHEIKNCIISKQYDFYAVVNKETLNINAFDEEIDAINFVLDFYNLPIGIQSKLF